MPSAEVPLYGLSETVLAPIWVWLLVSEVPSGLTLAGAATCRVALELPPGATLVAGPLDAGLESLAGGGVSETVEWVLYLPQGKPLVVRAEDRLAAPVARELAP